MHEMINKSRPIFAVAMIVALPITLSIVGILRSWDDEFHFLTLREHYPVEELIVGTIVMTIMMSIAYWSWYPYIKEAIKKAGEKK